MDRKLIDVYEAGGAKLAGAIAGLGAAELAAFPVPGTWSIHQIVVHVLDSDLTAIDRMKRIVAMHKPLLLGYDETAFANSLFYHEQSVADAVAIFDLSRRQWARVLRKLPDAAFERVGIHSERGIVTLGQLVGDYVHHLDHHLEFVARKRKMLGK